jgi:PAS domain S-box-containing protein
MKKCNILVVEDEALIAANLVHTLSSLGYTVHEPVATGEDAIRAVKAQQPDLVLMDIELIGAMDGIEAADKIRVIADIPIVYLTAYTDDLRIKQAQLTEPYGYIVKPAHSRELHATIEMALYKHGLDRKLKGSEERNRSIVEALPGIIFHFSADGRFIDCQFNKGDLLLLPPDQMIGKQVAEILPPDLAHLTERKIRETLDSGQLQTFEYSLTLHDQEHFFEARMITSGTNSVLAFIHDITERKVAEESLRESEEILRDIIEKNPLSIQIVDKDGFTLKVNHAHTLLFGSVPPSDFSIFADLVNKQPVLEKLILRVKSGEVVNLPDIYFNVHDIYPDFPNVPVWVRTIIFPLKGKSGKPERFVLMHENITERKVAEEALRESETKHRALFESIADTVFLIDQKTGNILDVNPAGSRQYGFNHDEFVRMNAVDVSAEPEQTVRAIERPVSNIPLRYHHRKDGSIFQVELTASTFELHGKTIIIATARDITERKRDEEILRESEARFRKILEMAPLPLCYVNVNGTITFRNERFVQIFGYTTDDVPTLAEWWQQAYPDAHYRQWVTTTWDAAVKRATEDGIDIKPVEYTVTCKSGEERIIEISGITLGEDFLATFIDLTERKVAEAAFRQLSADHKVIIDHAPAMVWYKDTKNNFIRVNPAGAQAFGLSIEEIEGKSTYDLFPDFAEKYYQDDLDVINSGKPRLGIIEPMTTASGEHLWVQTDKIPLRDEQGTITGILLFAVDITERKRAEGALRESETRFRTIIHSMQFGIVIIDANTHAILDTNDKALEMIGGSNDVIVGPVCHRFICPAELGKCPVTDLGQNVDSSERILLNLRGEKVPILKSVIRTTLGGKDVLIESFIDITARKKAEEALALASKKLTLLSSITRHDINNQLTILTGYLTILEKQQPDPTLTEYFLKVNNAAKRISAMVRFTKEYEQIGVHAPTWQECHTLVDTAAKQAPLGMVVVKNDLPAGAEMFADPLVVKVFYNLMDNAVRYGGKITTIRFSVEEAGDDQVIVCEDDGDGVVAAEKEKIFERGFGKNTGLGLALSREILSITGITIRETGELGKGARFEMVVPKGTWRIAGNST